MINKKDLELKLLLRESHIQQLNLRVDNLSSTINTLLQRNDDLKERINKAINYINEVWNTFDLTMGTKIIIRTIDRLLQGSDKDEN